ncbi:helix-turn-helix transcriptional regulator [Fusibacter bizertensis]|jgi:Predicted transcriptional regulators|uniref:Helix-turn-helix transcriptional regulator n=1 Tax=Fusibacter bizertensis TaxID=1488331 RepID=A0ABT6NGK7_9FIRM|nr:helix-turn-helix transcriptional regulator [Fusibacter bizertensis]MDH8679568.1 helix-turn-helix transcriptional regulator [Fusibacter bizertensis]
MGLSNTLKVQRAILGINQSELSNLVGVSRQTISLIERGDYNPSITLVLKLTKVFGVTTEELFHYEEDN